MGGGIRARLVGMSFGMVIPFLILSGYLAWQSLQTETARLHQNAIDEARERSSDVDLLINGWRQTLAVLAATPAMRDHRADEANQLFTELLQTYPYLSSAGALDRTRTFWASALPQLRGLRLTGEQGALTRDVIERGQGSVEAPVIRASGRNLPVSQIFLRQPIFSVDGEVSGVIQVGLPFENLEAALRLETLTPAAVVLLMDEDGIVLARSAGPDEAAGRSFLMESRPPSGASGVLEIRDEDGRDWLLAYQRTNALPWYAAVVQPLSEAYAPAWDIFRGTLIAVLGVFLFAAVIGRRIGLGIVRPIKYLALASRAIGRREFGHRVPVHGDRDTRQVASAFNQMASELESAYRDLERRVGERTAELERARSELERLNTDLQERVAAQVDEINRTAQLKRYLSPQIAEALISDHERIGGRTRRRNLSVLFADLRGFTALTESLPPEQLAPLLNSYLTVLTGAVFAEGGTLDKYLGDGLMAFFGDPVPFSDHADRAVRAALAMQDALKTVSTEGLRLDDRPLAIGVGITSGSVIVGSIGSSARLEYTAVGNNVNLAARLTSRAGAGEILCDAATARAVAGWAEVINRGPDFIKGRSTPIMVFQIQRAKAPAGVSSGGLQETA